MRTATEQHNKEKVLQAQLFIQNQLRKPLSLTKVATEVRLSNSHFHRLFKKLTGETLKTYISRLRTEMAYYEIRLTENSLLEIAQNLGFKNPETFTRVYKKHQGLSPSLVTRPSRKVEHHKTTQTQNINQGLLDASNDSIQVTFLRALSLIFKRHTGPYETVPLVAANHSPWQQMSQQLFTQKAGHQKPLFIGMPLDNPEVTHRSKLRYDMCVVMDADIIKVPTMNYKTIASGFYAVLTHAGPYKNLSQSYERLFTQASQLLNFKLSTQPMFELLLDIDAKTPDDHTLTSLYLPLIKTK